MNDTDVILSIKPKFVQEIRKGKKKYEFRRSFSRNIRFVYVYETAPVGKIVGTFEVKRVIEDTPRMLWTKFKDCAGIGERDFFEYFEGADSGFAVEIENFNEEKIPYDAEKLIPGFQPPQSFIYVPKKEKESSKLSDFPH
jgi:type I restriction enzyme, S subunit